MGALPKPAKGTATKERRKKARARKGIESANMIAVRNEDQVCRFPFCACRHEPFAPTSILEVAHLYHRGMGGDPSGARSTPDKLILLCRGKHQELPVSLHKGTLKIVPLTDKGTRGPCRFDIYLKDGTLDWIICEVPR